MTYYIETEKNHCEGRNVILVRSNVRPRTFERTIAPSGETQQQNSEDSEDLELDSNVENDNNIRNDNSTRAENPTPGNNPTIKNKTLQNITNELVDDDTELIFRDDAFDDDPFDETIAVINDRGDEEQETIVN